MPPLVCSLIGRSEPVERSSVPVCDLERAVLGNIRASKYLVMSIKNGRPISMRIVRANHEAVISHFRDDVTQILLYFTGHPKTATFQCLIAPDEWKNMG